MPQNCNHARSNDTDQAWSCPEVEYELRVSTLFLNRYFLRLLQAFDELLLLKRGGRVIYGGATGSRSETLIAYFQAVPDVPPVSEGVNPATWMLEVRTASVAIPPMQRQRPLLTKL